MKRCSTSAQVGGLLCGEKLVLKFIIFLSFLSMITNSVQYREVNRCSFRACHRD